MKTIYSSETIATLYALNGSVTSKSFLLPSLFIILFLCHEVAILNGVIYVGLIEKVALEQEVQEGVELAILSGKCGAGGRNSHSVPSKAKANTSVFKEHPRGHRSWNRVIKGRVAEGEDFSCYSK